MVHIHNGILLSYKKKHIFISSNEVDEPGTYHTEYNNSEKETQIPYAAAAAAVKSLQLYLTAISFSNE